MVFIGYCFTVCKVAISSGWAIGVNCCNIEGNGCDVIHSKSCKPTRSRWSYSYGIVMLNGLSLILYCCLYHSLSLIYNLSLSRGYSFCLSSDCSIDRNYLSLSRCNRLINGDIIGDCFSLSLG